MTQSQTAVRDNQMPDLAAVATEATEGGQPASEIVGEGEEGTEALPGPEVESMVNDQAGVLGAEDRADVIGLTEESYLSQNGTDVRRENCQRKSKLKEPYSHRNQETELSFCGGGVS